MANTHVHEIFQDILKAVAPDKVFDRSEAPKYSPWGAVQSATEVAPGLWSVSTAGHGGLKLSRERNAAMPDYMRSPGGWYEEDSQWSLVALVFPEPFRALLPWQKPGDRTFYESALETARNWHAGEYERFFGVTLAPAESYQRRREQFERETRDRFVVRAAWGDWARFVPPGMVGVVAERKVDGVERWFLIPKAEYRTTSIGGFVIDETRHPYIPQPKPEDMRSR